MVSGPEWSSSREEKVCFFEASVSLPACGLRSFEVRPTWACILALGLLGCSQPPRVLVSFFGTEIIISRHLPPWSLGPGVKGED